MDKEPQVIAVEEKSSPEMIKHEIDGYIVEIKARDIIQDQDLGNETKKEIKYVANSPSIEIFLDGKKLDFVDFSAVRSLWWGKKHEELKDKEGLLSAFKQHMYSRIVGAVQILDTLYVSEDNYNPIKHKEWVAKLMDLKSLPESDAKTETLDKLLIEIYNEI